jgi:hypothetical protein
MSQYQPKKGEEAYVHLLVTKKGGQAIEPKTELYHPQQVAEVMKLAGFDAEILYDPRTADQKQQQAPANDTVKATESLSSADSYRARYRTLFHEEVPFNLTNDEVKRIVDMAETKLAEFLGGPKPVEPETDEQRITREAKEAQAKQDAADGLPTNKTEWFALFQQTFPDDATAYEDITVPKMREKLGK